MTKRLYEDAIAGPEFAEVKARLAHLRSRFGWQHLVEMTVYREQLTGEGCRPEDLHLAASQRYVAAHRDDMSLNERQAHFRALPPSVGMGLYTTLGLRESEVAWLIERLEGTNDPTGLDILERLRRSFR